MLPAVSSPAPTRALSLPRKLVFAAVAAGLALWGLNAGIEWAEQRGLIRTQGPGGSASLLGERIVVRDGDDWVTTRYAETTMVRSRFPAAKGDRVRVFLTGGSFAQGAPYTYPDQPEEGFGGIASWLRDAFAEAVPPVEVLNVAAGGQDSHRVKRIVEELVELQPDAIVVATCNNEGAVQPTTMQELLHQFGGVRLLTGFLRPPPAADPALAWYQPDSEQAQEFDRVYVENLEAIIATTRTHGVPLLLATVPLQLRHGGNEAGAGPAWIPRQWSGEDQVDVCIAEGRALLDDGKPADAVMRLAECGTHPAARESLEAAYMALWRAGMTSQEGDLSPGPCVAELLDLFRQREFEALLAAAPTCEDAPIDALFWSGLALAELDRLDEATRALEQSAELRPSGRCRPSLNRTVRWLAAEHEHVTLVDLDALARAASPKGLPGPELFASNCHLQWSGYWLMAQAVADALQEAGIVRGERRLRPAEDLEAYAAEHGLSANPWTRDVIARRSGAQP
jgi:hypothetical protein